jgi:tRNA(adenine34) deaminase
MMENKKIYMRKSIALAEVAKNVGEIPVGAVVVENGTIIGQGYNRQIRDSDPTAHAEIVALRDASGRKNNFRLDGAQMYATINPCSMCREAIKRARVSEVYYSSPRARPATHKVSYTKVRDYFEQGSDILKNFFRQKR